MQFYTNVMWAFIFNSSNIFFTALIFFFSKSSLLVVRTINDKKEIYLRKNIFK